jgi:hypothetical protein
MTSKTQKKNESLFVIKCKLFLEAQNTLNNRTRVLKAFFSVTDLHWAESALRNSSQWRDSRPRRPNGLIPTRRNQSRKIETTHTDIILYMNLRDSRPRQPNGLIPTRRNQSRKIETTHTDIILYINLRDSRPRHPNGPIPTRRNQSRKTETTNTDIILYINLRDGRPRQPNGLIPARRNQSRKTETMNTDITLYINFLKYQLIVTRPHKSARTPSAKFLQTDIKPLAPEFYI